MSFKYATFREDKAAEPGYSKELISCDFDMFKNTTNVDELNTWPHPGIDTLTKAIHRLNDQMPNHQMFGTKVTQPDGSKKYEWMTVKEVVETSKYLAAGIAHKNLIPEVEAEDRQWRFLGLQSKNRKEWYLMHIANMHNNTTSVAFYDTLGPDAARFICMQTELATIGCTADQVEIILKLKEDDPEGKMANVTNIIVFESSVDKNVLALADTVGISITTMDECIEVGKQNFASWKAQECTPDDTCMFSYTSGTTGDPKGVKLTHKMLVQCSASVNARLRATNASLNHLDTYISYLPAAHSFEQALFGIVCSYGMRCGFFGGDPLLLLKEDLPLLQPTFFPSVPRVYNKIYGILTAKIKELTGVKACLINQGLATKLANYKATGSVTHCFYDILFKKFKAALGGKVRFMITGSAPISPDVLDFLKVTMCAPIIEGYGMTETCAGSVTQFIGDKVSGTVGGPLANVKIRLRDIPEMEYLTSQNPPKGEVCMWGPSIMKGYFKNPEKTEEALKDGWLHSGDVGQINPDGSLKIIDRAKNIFKLSFGEYIAPEKLENIYIKSEWLAQIWIYGDSLKDFIVAFAPVDQARVQKYQEDQKGGNNKVGTTEDLLNDESFKQMVYEDLMMLAKDSNLNSLEKPKNFILMWDPFSDKDDLLTPTFKMKRNVAMKHFDAQIQDMYAAGIKYKDKK